MYTLLSHVGYQCRLTIAITSVPVAGLDVVAFWLYQRSELTWFSRALNALDLDTRPIQIEPGGRECRGRLGIPRAIGEAFMTLLEIVVSCCLRGAGLRVDLQTLLSWLIQGATYHIH